MHTHHFNDINKCKLQIGNVIEDIKKISNY